MYKINFNFSEYGSKYVVSDSLEINFLVNGDIDGFKEYLETD